MQYKTYLPNSELKDIVKRYVVITDLKNNGDLLFIPSAGNFLVFNRGISGYSHFHSGEKVDIPNSASISFKPVKAKTLVLDMSKYEEIEFPILLVELQAIGFYKIFGKDASTLANKHQVIEEKFMEKYFSKVYTHQNIDEEIKYIENSLARINLHNNNKREYIEVVLDKIEESKYEVPIEKLAREFGCSRRNLERGFKKFIGMSPKNYMQTSKFHQSFISYIAGNKSFKQMEFLYTDSSHFNIVSKRLTGKTPRQLYKAIKEKKELQLYGIEG